MFALTYRRCIAGKFNVVIVSSSRQLVSVAPTVDLTSTRPNFVKVAQLGHNLQQSSRCLRHFHPWPSFDLQILQKQESDKQRCSLGKQSL